MGEIADAYIWGEMNGRDMDDPEPDWQYIIDHKCLCCFWDDSERYRQIGFLTEYDKYDTLLHYKKDNEIPYKHCRPVRRDEVTFYEEKEDEI